MSVETKLVCDSCGKKEKGYMYFGKIDYKTVPPYMSSTGSEIKEVSLDLCQECMWWFQDKIVPILKDKKGRER